MILAIYSKINDEIESLEDNEDFAQLNQKIEEELKAKQKIEENGYVEVENEEKNAGSNNNILMEDGNEGEDIELE